MVRLIGKKKICLLGANFSTSNMGVGALAAGALRSFIRGFPDSEFYLLDYSQEEKKSSYIFDDNEVVLHKINMRFSKNIFLLNHIAMLLVCALVIKIFPIGKVRGAIIARNSYLARLEKIDLFASLAGGDSFSDIYGMERFFYVSLPQILVLILGKPLVLLPQTLGPFRRSVTKGIARYIVERASLVYSRDPEGLKEIAEVMGVVDLPAKFRFCYDVGFVLEPKKPVCETLEKIAIVKKSYQSLVGVNVSGLLLIGGYTQKNMFGLNIDYKQLVIDVIRKFLSIEDVSVMLVPHVFGTREHMESDLTACEEICNVLRPQFDDSRLFRIQEKFDQHEIKYLIGQCGFFVGSRMHACIAALSQGVPAVSIAYSKKFQGVLGSIGCGEMVVDPRTMDRNQILDVIEEKYGERDVIRRYLEGTISIVQEKIFNSVSELGECLKLPEH
jgi:colanic acid/amylovoran biosynthesis protein